jgi:hypothetical protein
MTAFEELGKTTTGILSFGRYRTVVGTLANTVICGLRVSGLMSYVLPTTLEPVAAQVPGRYLCLRQPKQGPSGMTVSGAPSEVYRVALYQARMGIDAWTNFLILVAPDSSPNMVVSR